MFFKYLFFLGKILRADIFFTHGASWETPPTTTKTLKRIFPHIFPWSKISFEPSLQCVMVFSQMKWRLNFRICESLVSRPEKKLRIICKRQQQSFFTIYVLRKRKSSTSSSFLTTFHRLTCKYERKLICASSTAEEWNNQLNIDVMARRIIYWWMKVSSRERKWFSESEEF